MNKKYLVGIVTLLFLSFSLAIPSVLSSGVFPIGFTLLSWGLAAKIGLRLRK